jgi:hypothetical protein
LPESWARVSRGTSARPFAGLVGCGSANQAPAKGAGRPGAVASVSVKLRSVVALNEP